MVRVGAVAIELETDTGSVRGSLDDVERWAAGAGGVVVDVGGQRTTIALEHVIAFTLLPDPLIDRSDELGWPE